MYCSKCGEKASPNQKFCQFCGASLKSASSSQSASIYTSSDSPSKSVYQTQPSSPSSSVSSKPEKESKKYSKRCFILAIVSFVLFIISISTGTSLFFALRDSIHLEFDLFYAYLILLSYPPEYLFYYLPPPMYVLDEGLMALGYQIGIVLIISSIAGFVLGIVSRRVRRTAVHTESKNGLTIAGGVFAVLGIIFNIITPIISVLIFTTPIYVTIQNISAGFI